MPFLDLPEEIHLRTLSNLDYKSFVYATSSYCYMRNLPSPQMIRNNIEKSGSMHPQFFWSPVWEGQIALLLSSKGADI
jgi:hypothetical protein